MIKKFLIRSSCRVAGLPVFLLASFLVAGAMLLTSPLDADEYWAVPPGQSGNWATALNWSGSLAHHFIRRRLYHKWRNCNYHSARRCLLGTLSRRSEQREHRYDSNVRRWPFGFE